MREVRVSLGMRNVYEHHGADYDLIVKGENVVKSVESDLEFLIKKGEQDGNVSK